MDRCVTTILLDALVWTLSIEPFKPNGHYMYHQF